ncbi:fibronectin domain containing protein [Nitzschia inconspicua]|uniref:Fibronectin domain containing protein n=1 Tax=Nitzschia inconspicua TaxID=303405 RepID=A0A9K3Q029_9STRA|nr:fibronectin domain containing protein [Nitzschia inconspicua]
MFSATDVGSEAAIVEQSTRTDVSDALSVSLHDFSDAEPYAVPCFPVVASGSRQTLASTVSMVPDENSPPEATVLDDAQLEAEYTGRMIQKAVLAESISVRKVPNKSIILVSTLLFLVVTAVVIGMVLNADETDDVIGDDLSFCQIQHSCEQFSGIPVDVNGFELKQAIKEYLKNKAASPYGSRIFCWDVSQVTNLSFAFSVFDDESDPLYNPDYDDDLRYMFSGANAFNQDIGSWDVSYVTNMSYLFSGANVFDRDIGSWDVSRVTDMSHMFASTAAFDEGTVTWDLHEGGMFKNAHTFNQDIGSWDVSSVKDTSYMFAGAYVFNQDIGSWDVSNVRDMSWMFAGADAFNQDIGSWDVSGVIDMSWMFAYANAFDQDIRSWNISSVKDIGSMFGDEHAFNQDIGY